jgi:ParB family protein of integrating conjugative element (PFGI_1 class)
MQEGRGDAATTRQPAAPSARHVSIEERRRLVAESLRVGNPGNNARDLPTRADPRHDCQIELPVDEIRPYESNPRRAANARFAEIKESIRSSGIRNPLTVTRRPGEAYFIVEAGGNTRLHAIQELWAETRDARFEKLVVLFRPWRSESHVLTSHLIENELRGEMTFWDKATGVVALKSRLEADKGEALSLRQLEDEMKGLGLTVNTATLAHSLFAIERLRTLGEAVAELSGLDVKTMQPQLNLLKRYAHARANIAEGDLYASVFEPVFQEAVDRYRQSRAFCAAEVCRACEETLARHLGEAVEQLRGALQLPARRPRDAAETAPAHPITGGAGQTPDTTPAVTANSREAQRSVSRANAGMAATDLGDRRSGTLPTSGETPAAHSSFIEQVRIFAGMSGLDGCLRVHANAPRGYAMDALPVTTDGEMLLPARLRAWRLLALLSGQLDDHAVEVPGNADARFSSDSALLRWLIDSHDEAAGVFWKVLTLARESGSPPLLRDNTDTAIPALGNV